MTRKLVYAGALVAFLAAFAMTLSSITIPRWISWDVTNSEGAPIHYTYGLHQRCSSLTGKCDYFPSEKDCLGDERYFCSLWRSAGFLMSFAVVLEGGTLVAFIVMLVSGKQQRVTGWRVLSGILFIVSIVEASGMSIVAYLFDNDERFFPGWNLDASFALCTASWCIMMLTAAGLVASAFVLPEEAGYELIPDALPELA